jgi:hypothetical protein
MLSLAPQCAIARADHSNAPRDRRAGRLVGDCCGAGCAIAALDAASGKRPAKQGVGVSGMVIWVPILAVLWIGANAFAWALAVMAGRGDEELQRERAAAEAKPPVDERFSRVGTRVRPRARARS